MSTIVLCVHKHTNSNKQKCKIGGRNVCYKILIIKFMLVTKYNLHLYNKDNMNEYRGLERQIMHCSKMNYIYIYIYNMWFFSFLLKFRGVEMIVGLQYG